MIIYHFVYWTNGWTLINMVYSVHKGLQILLYILQAWSLGFRYNGFGVEQKLACTDILMCNVLWLAEVVLYKVDISMGY